MKKVVFLVTLLASMTAMAGGFSSVSKIQFQAGDAWINADKVCQDSGYLYLKSGELFRKLDVDDNKAEDEFYKPMVQPMNSSKNVCMVFAVRAGECVEYAKTNFTQDSYTVKTYSSQQYMENDYNPTSVVTKSIDLCPSALATPAL